MPRLGADENQGGDAVGCGSRQLKRARSANRAADDDQAIPSHQLQRLDGPFLDAVA